jgi:hypothetical protein
MLNEKPVEIDSIVYIVESPLNLSKIVPAVLTGNIIRYKGKNYTLTNEWKIRPVELKSKYTMVTVKEFVKRNRLVYSGRRANI